MIGGISPESPISLINLFASFEVELLVWVGFIFLAFEGRLSSSSSEWKVYPCDVLVRLMMKGEWCAMPNIMKRKVKGGSASFECIEVFGFYKLSNLKIITFLLINRN